MQDAQQKKQRHAKNQLNYLQRQKVRTTQRGTLTTLETTQNKMAQLEQQASALQQQLDALEQQRRSLQHRTMLLQRRLDMATEALHTNPGFLAGTDTVDARAVPLQVAASSTVLLEGRPSKVPVNGAAVLQNSATLDTPDQLMDAFDSLVGQLGALSLEHDAATEDQRPHIEKQLQQVCAGLANVYALHHHT